MEDLQNKDKQNPDADQRSRADINRENSMKSTGPTSDAGKAASSQNALKHGAYRPLTIDDLYKIDEIYRSFCLEQHPEGVAEQIEVRIMAESWHRKLLVDRWFFGAMELHYENQPMKHADPLTPSSTIEDYRTWATNKKDIATFDRLSGIFLGRYERALRRLQGMQRTRRTNEARIARSGDDRRTGAPMEKGKFHDVSFGLWGSLVKERNEARLKALEPSRKVDLPPDGEKK